MPTYSKEREQIYIERIRSIIIQRPDASLTEIKETLAKHPRDPVNLDRNYIGKLRDKIHKSREFKIAHYRLHTYLGKFEEENEEIKKRCWTIANDRTTTTIEKLNALRDIRATNESTFDKLFDSGVFEKKGPALLPGGNEVFKLWGQLKSQTLEIVGSVEPKNGTEPSDTIPAEIVPKDK